MDDKITSSQKPSNLFQVLGVKRILMLVVVAVAIAVTFLLVFRNDDIQNSQENNSVSDEEVNVEITGAGFEPKTLLVGSGTKVTWVNNDVVTHNIQANPYPEGTELPGLNTTQPIAPGATYSFIFSSKGKFGYHDKSDPLSGGEVIVE